MQVRTLAMAGMALVAACASGPSKPRMVGDAPELGARLVINDSVSPPRQVTVEVAQASSAVLVYVVPGQGASLVYPADTLHSARLTEGAHVVSPEFPKLLSASAARAARDSARRGGAMPGERDPRDARSAPAVMPPQVIVPQGFLMLIATRASLDPAAIARRLQGTSIPGVDDEALNAVGKLVRSTANVVAPWAGVALPVKLPTQPEARRAPSRSSSRR
jgi:hypothetical protein